ncbi:MAG: exodeoxyribonuclease VII large subunit [Gammaproteobacteria bacterium]
MPVPASDTERTVYTVSALARAARVLLEDHFQVLWVEGEVSNFRRPASGHWYFTLKDSDAQLRCAMFAGRNRAHRREPRDGDRVLVRGRLSLYEPRGDFQFIAEHLEPAGAGALRAAFEALKTRLAAEGLFDPARKRPLPAMPRRLAIISSASAAALRDVLHVIERRFPVLDVVLLPVSVQGDAAANEIVAALARVGSTGADVALLTRGGGSLEDLWAFNLEPVARAIAACPIPVVSAIGHQTDFTIADFVADLRAPTPSAGAELLTPDRVELHARLDAAAARLTRALSGQLHGLGRHTAHLRARLVNPKTRLEQQMQRADELAERLTRAVIRQREAAALRLRMHARRLLRAHPATRLPPASAALTRARMRLTAAQARAEERRNARLVAAVRALSALSPLATLGRGYAILTDPSARQLTAVTSVAGVVPGQSLRAHLRDGTLTLSVQSGAPGHGLPDLGETSDP